MPTPYKLLIQMSGAPGSGKSTIANLLSRSINAVVINHDLYKTLFLTSNIPFEQASKLTYDLDWVLVDDMMKQGHSVIIDSTCNYSETLENGTKIARRHGWDYWYVECKFTDIGELDWRLRARTPLRSQRVSVEEPPLDAVAARHFAEDGHVVVGRKIENPVRPAGDSKHVIVVDSSRSAEGCVEEILKRIGVEFGGGQAAVENAELDAQSRYTS